MGARDWRWNLGALFCSQTLSLVSFSFVLPFFPLYIQSLGISEPAAAAQWAGVCTAATAVSMVVAQPVWGSIADRTGRKPMLVRSMVGAVVTLVTMGFATSVEQLLVLRFFQGMVTGTVPAANALAAGSAPRGRLGFALGVMQVAIFVGTSVGPLVGGFVADRLGFRAPFYAAALLMAVGVTIVLTLVREDFTPPPRDLPRPGPLAEMRSLIGLAAVPPLAATVFMIQLGVLVLTPVLPLFIADLNAGRDPGTASGVVLAGTGVASAVSALVLGRMGDRIGHGRILVVCLAASALTYFPQALVQQVWQLFVLRLLLGVALGGLMPSANALLAGLVPRERRGAVFGLTAASSAMANAVGPLAGAFVATHFGMRSIFTFTGALYVLAVCWVGIGLRRETLPARVLVSEARADRTGVAEERAREATGEPGPRR